ncbi:MAG: ABC transporter substrate-binding protein [Bdellovibrionales bacterium]|nr:ABC transporter substrate-binding protein [Ramlibacter sp.]
MPRSFVLSQPAAPIGWQMRAVMWWMAAMLLALVWCPAQAADSPKADSADQVTLQLKWYHQFQFAGYYAAQARGFYRKEGLEVLIREGGPDRAPLTSVLSGSAQFSIGDSDLLVARIKGQPIVALAAIFQHSPYVLLSRKDSYIRAPSDLAGKTVMTSDDQGGIQLRCMLRREGIDPRRINIVPQSWRLEDLIYQRVDVISAYATVEPAKMRARGIDTFEMRSLDYGVDFYGDILFTSEQEVTTHSARTAAFVRTTQKGWEYAMSHEGEIADLILTMEGVARRGVTRPELMAEAQTMRPFVLAGASRGRAHQCCSWSNWARG